MRLMINAFVVALAFGLLGCGGKDSYAKLTEATVEFNEKLLDLIEGVTDGYIDEAKAGDIVDGLEDVHADLRRRLKALPTPTVEETRAMMTAVADSAKRMPAVFAKARTSGKFSDALNQRIGNIARK